MYLLFAGGVVALVLGVLLAVASMGSGSPVSVVLGVLLLVGGLVVVGSALEEV